MYRPSPEAPFRDRCFQNDTELLYGQTANEDQRKSEFESKRILNVEGGLS